ncbi:MAG TPA: SET domain-containing protein-lysine N-methyltransferase [Gemmatimonadaceae bacterium]
MPPTEQPYFEIRASATHGSGAFAIRPIPACTRLIEYTGERVSHEEADSRPDVDDGTGSTHVLLFTVDRRTVIDARVGGNEAQFFNHSCDGNCEAVIEKRRVYLETRRAVAPGEELTYDYEMEYSGEDLETARSLYPCRCGAPNCRGTLLDMPVATRKSASRPRRKSRAGKSTAARTARGKREGKAAAAGNRTTKAVKSRKRPTTTRAVSATGSRGRRPT